MDPLSFPQKKIDKWEAQFSPLTTWEQFYLDPFTAKFSQKQISTKFSNFSLWNFENQIELCVSTGRELSFEWSHHRIPSRDSNSHLTKLHQVFWRWKGELEELKLKVKAKQIILFVESKHLLSSIILPINLLLGHNKLMVSCTTKSARTMAIFLSYAR